MAKVHAAGAWTKGLFWLDLFSQPDEFDAHNLSLALRTIADDVALRDPESIYANFLSQLAAAFDDDPSAPFGVRIKHRHRRRPPEPGGLRRAIQVGRYYRNRRAAGRERKTAIYETMEKFGLSKSAVERAIMKSNTFIAHTEETLLDGSPRPDR